MIIVNQTIIHNTVHTIYDTGVESWFKVGTTQYHRLDGPAFIDPRINYMKYYLDGKSYTFKEYCTKVKTLISDEEYFILILTYGNQNETG